MAVITIKKKIKPPKLKPGQKAHLSRDKIALKAIALIEQTPALTLKDLATALNVAPMTVRNHFPGGLEEVKLEASRRLLVTIGRPFHPHESWDHYLQDLFVSASSLFLAHPKLASGLPSQIASHYRLNPYLIERLLFTINLAGVPKSNWTPTLDLIMTSLIGLAALISASGSNAETWTEADLGPEFPMTKQLLQQDSATKETTDLAIFFAQQLTAALLAQAKPPSTPN